MLMVVLTMVIATQYAVTELGYEYTIVHPSNADIRFIGSDNSSDGVRVLRVDGTNGTNAKIKIELGNWSANQNKTYTAAFGIVNEEKFAVNITHINVSTTGTDYMQIWLHGDRDENPASDSTSVFMWDKGSIVNASTTTAWTLAYGDANKGTMKDNVSAGGTITTPWDDTAHVRYSVDDTNAYGVGVNGRTITNASDFVWVQVSIDLPASPTSGGAQTGTIWIHFEATTQYGED